MKQEASQTDLNSQLIAKAVSKQNALGSPRNYTAFATFRNLTHLHLNNQGITTITDLQTAPNLEVLYLYDNNLNELAGLSHLKSLSALYLQNNQLRSLSGLEGLSKLQKLYANGNSIQLLDSLQSLTSLRELDLSDQRLQPREQLRFEPASTAALGRSLQHLAASRCQISEVSPLACLRNLVSLDLADNMIGSLDALDEGVMGLQQLSELRLVGNPCTRRHKYRDQVILMLDSLQLLDDVQVTSSQRAFLLQLNIKRMRAALAAANISQQQSATGGALLREVSRKFAATHQQTTVKMGRRGSQVQGPQHAEQHRLSLQPQVIPRQPQVLHQVYQVHSIPAASAGFYPRAQRNSGAETQGMAPGGARLSGRTLPWLQNEDEPQQKDVWDEWWREEPVDGITGTHVKQQYQRSSGL